MDEKTNAEALDVQRTPAGPNPAEPAAAAEVTTALDPSAHAGETAARPLPEGEPAASGAEPPTDPPNAGLSFLLPGTRTGSLGRLGHFEVLELLGKGGFGIVLKAFDEK